MPDLQSLLHPRRKARAVDSVTDKDRRAFLRLAMAQGIAAPAALAAFECPVMAATLPPAPQMRQRKGAMRHAVAAQTELHASGAIVRDFADPHLELLRLLREAAEIEHALMLQYLYCAFSLRGSYQSLAGDGQAKADSLIGVAIQEMRHLAAVNRLLVALGGCPHLDRQDFPYEPDIYPFQFELEPISRSCLAKYVFCEAPAGVFDKAAAKSADDEAFRLRVIREFRGTRRPNHVGSLYRSILGMLDEVTRMRNSPISPSDADAWRSKLVEIMEEGEVDHYKFFRSAFDATHPALCVAGVESVWLLDRTDPKYPAHPVPTNPTAYVGHPNQITSTAALVLAWLGNLHYWLTLSTLDLAYRYKDDTAISLAMVQMMSTLWPLAATLPLHGAGMPFDPLSMGYALGTGIRESKRIIVSLGREALSFARSIEHRLPSNYDMSATDQLIEYMSA